MRRRVRWSIAGQWTAPTPRRRRTPLATARRHPPVRRRCWPLGTRVLRSSRSADVSRRSLLLCTARLDDDRNEAAGWVQRIGDHTFGEYLRDRIPRAVSRRRQEAPQGAIELLSLAAEHDRREALGRHRQFLAIDDVGTNDPTVVTSECLASVAAFLESLTACLRCCIRPASFADLSRYAMLRFTRVSAEIVGSTIRGKPRLAVHEVSTNNSPRASTRWTCGTRPKRQTAWFRTVAHQPAPPGRHRSDL